MEARQETLVEDVAEAHDRADDACGDGVEAGRRMAALGGRLLVTEDYHQSTAVLVVPAR